MEKDKSNSIINLKTSEISVLKVGNKQMTVSVFNQLYEAPPFDLDFNITNELWGKVNRNDTYVIFKNDEGIRKFNLSGFNKELSANEFSVSLAKAIDGKSKSFELEIYKKKLITYYQEKAEYQSRLSDLLKNLGSDFPESLNYSDDGKLLESELSGEFREEALAEFERGLKRLKNRNKLVSIFRNLPQLFIAV